MALTRASAPVAAHREKRLFDGVPDPEKWLLSLAPQFHSAAAFAVLEGFAVLEDFAAFADLRK